MNKETYEALKRVTKDLRRCYRLKNKDFRIARTLPLEIDLLVVEEWIDEVKKDIV